MTLRACHFLAALLGKETYHEEEICTAHFLTVRLYSSSSYRAALLLKREIMTTQQLKQSIERFHQHIKNSSPLFLNAKNGTLTDRHIAEYLKNILYLIRHTPIHLSLAKKRSSELSLFQLEQFFNQKLKEEHDHDRWAEQDLIQFLGSKEIILEDLSFTIKALISMIEETIQKDPRQYLAYVFFSEYFTVLGGDEWMEDLEKQCKIHRSSMTVIGNHVDLDKAHVQEDILQINSLVEETGSFEKLSHSLQNFMNLFESFCVEMGTVAT